MVFPIEIGMRYNSFPFIIQGCNYPISVFFGINITVFREPQLHQFFFFNWVNINCNAFIYVSIFITLKMQNDFQSFEKR